MLGIWWCQASHRRRGSDLVRTGVISSPGLPRGRSSRRGRPRPCPGPFGSRHTFSSPSSSRSSLRVPSGRVPSYSLALSTRTASIALKDEKYPSPCLSPALALVHLLCQRSATSLPHPRHRRMRNTGVCTIPCTFSSSFSTLNHLIAGGGTFRRKAAPQEASQRSLGSDDPRASSRPFRRRGAAFPGPFRDPMTQPQTRALTSPPAKPPAA